MGALVNYIQQHAEWANIHKPVRNKRVLVIGCNTGGDCRPFVELGAKRVHGVDIAESIGADYQHSKVAYFRMSAEKMTLDSNYYDLVFSVATMEHVPDICSAFREMARVTVPGGLIYCIASPLWNSRHGHHFPHYFSEYPWIHLRCDPSQMLSYLLDERIRIAIENGSAETVVNYIADPCNFNMRPSSDYMHAASALADFDVLRHALDYEPEESLPPEVLVELQAKGFTSHELRAVTHTFIARKQKPFWKLW